MSTADLNSYGDHLVPTTGMHGADIASQRIDHLDREALQQILSLSNPRITCLDLGCGFGWQGVRFAMLAADAHLFDLLPESPLIKCLRETAGLSLSYTAKDLRHLTPDDLPERADLAFSQRFIHYLEYAEADRLIHLVAARMPAHSFFYISASGLHSELGHNYRDAGATLHSRFSVLDPPLQAKHGIREPVCLYTQADLIELMTASGFAEHNVWTSTFGNVKGVFRKSN